jgi:hypothetical protein
MIDDFEHKRSALHDVVGAGGDVPALVRPWGKAVAQRVIDQVLADYVTELNRTLAAAGTTMYAIDAATFMQQYAVLWQAKLTL